MRAVTTRDHNPRYLDGPPDGGLYRSDVRVHNDPVPLSPDSTSPAPLNGASMLAVRSLPLFL